MTDTQRTGLVPPKSAQELLDMYYLEARSYLLETAAILDRIERAPDSDTIMQGPKIQTLYTICDLLKHKKNNRAEKILNRLSV